MNHRHSEINAGETEEGKETGNTLFDTLVDLTYRTEYATELGRRAIYSHLAADRAFSTYLELSCVDEARKYAEKYAAAYKDGTTTTIPTAIPYISLVRVDDRIKMWRARVQIHEGGRREEFERASEIAKTIYWDEPCLLEQHEKMMQRLERFISSRQALSSYLKQNLEDFNTSFRAIEEARTVLQMHPERVRFQEIWNRPAFKEAIRTAWYLEQEGEQDPWTWTRDFMMEYVERERIERVYPTSGVEIEIKHPEQDPGFATIPWQFLPERAIIADKLGYKTSGDWQLEIATNPTHSTINLTREIHRLTRANLLPCNAEADQIAFSMHYNVLLPDERNLKHGDAQVSVQNVINAVLVTAIPLVVSDRRMASNGFGTISSVKKIDGSWNEAKGRHRLEIRPLEYNPTFSVKDQVRIFNVLRNIVIGGIMYQYHRESNIGTLHECLMREAGTIELLGDEALQHKAVERMKGMGTSTPAEKHQWWTRLERYSEQIDAAYIDWEHRLLDWH